MNEAFLTICLTDNKLLKDPHKTVVNLKPILYLPYNLQISRKSYIHVFSFSKNFKFFNLTNGQMKSFYTITHFLLFYIIEGKRLPEFSSFKFSFDQPNVEFKCRFKQWKKDETRFHSNKCLHSRHTKKE